MLDDTPKRLTRGSGSVGDVPSEAGFGTKVSSLVVEIDEYQGKKRTRVKWMNDIDRRPKQREPGTPLKLKTLKTAGRKAAGRFRRHRALGKVALHAAPSHWRRKHSTKDR